MMSGSFCSRYSGVTSRPPGALLKRLMVSGRMSR
jgi:hypothetical protein